MIKCSREHYDVSVQRLKRLLGIAGVLVAGLLYVWVAAVRAVPTVKRQKEARRAARVARAG